MLQSLVLIGVGLVHPLSDLIVEHCFLYLLVRPKDECLQLAVKLLVVGPVGMVGRADLVAFRYWLGLIRVLVGIGV